MSALLSQLEGRERRAECEKHEALEPCPNCGSDDVRFCAIAVRYHCGECNYGPTNFGTKAQGRSAWNDASRKANKSIDDVRALRASHQRLKEALQLMLDQGERCNWFADSGDEEVANEAREALRSTP